MKAEKPQDHFQEGIEMRKDHFIENFLRAIKKHCVDCDFAIRLAHEGPHPDSVQANLELFSKTLSAFYPNGNIPEYNGSSVPVSMHRHPHHGHPPRSRRFAGFGERREHHANDFPLQMPTRLIRLLAEDDERAVEMLLADLADGPPHLVMERIITVYFLEFIYDAAPEKR